MQNPTARRLWGAETAQERKREEDFSVLWTFCISGVLERAHVGSRRPRFESRLCCALAVCPQAGHLASLGLSVGICTWEVMGPPCPPRTVRVGNTGQSEPERLWKGFLFAEASLKGLWLQKRTTWVLQQLGVGSGSAHSPSTSHCAWYRMRIELMFVE